MYVQPKALMKVLVHFMSSLVSILWDDFICECHDVMLLSQPSDFNANIEWSSVFQTARPYDPYLIPIPICMGRQDKGELPPPALNNAELIKVRFVFYVY